MYWPFYLAFKQLFPSGRKGSFFAWVATGGVMLGVMVLIVVQCVMGGFGNQIRQLVVETGGDIRIQAGYPFESTQALIDVLNQAPGVIAYAPYAEGVVMLQHAGRPTFPIIRGIDLFAERQVVALDTYVKQGILDELDEDGILLSSGLAHSISAFVGSQVSVYSPLMLDKLDQEEVFLPKNLTVVGIFETGWNQVDANLCLVALPTMQELYGLSSHQIHGFALRLNNAAIEPQTLAWLGSHLPRRLSAYSVLDANRDLLFILRLEKMTLFFIILFVILVAAFSITSSLMTSVVRKTREIGLLSALGASPWQIAICFCFQGLIIGIVGTGLGTMGALLALFFRNDVIHIFARWTNSEAALQHFYQFANLPASYDPLDFAIILPTAIVITALAGLFPAIKAARLRPAEALRFDG